MTVFKKKKLILLPLFLMGCASQSLTPQVSDVKASHDSPPEKCIQVSKVTGSTSSAKGTTEDALEDLKKDAANKGANYVKVDEYSSYGTAVTGVAYKCP
jgi:hypothetical protein